MSNPFTLSFGKKPAQFISRITQTNEIVENFRADVPSNQIYMLTGVRGSGKTVMMTTVSNIIALRLNSIQPGIFCKVLPQNCMEFRSFRRFF